MYFIFASGWVSSGTAIVPSTDLLTYALLLPVERRPPQVALCPPQIFLSAYFSLALSSERLQNSLMSVINIYFLMP